ncbi:MAG TPA: glycosyltransferase family 39 protein [Candidatus Acidoferrales bacterium]|nr:glycosyltransferase family 39 protein [Candidatus Acidoferrales bacterium]
MTFFFFSRNNGGDAFARAAVTARWLQHPSFSLDFGGPRWPPLHFWLMALFAQIVPDVILACRLLSLVAGLMSLWLFWRLVSRLYGDWAAILSLAVFTFYSLHIAYSTTSSSEEIFVAFVLGGLLGVFTFRASGKYGALVAGGLSLTAAAAIRFEAWIVIFALALIFLLGQESRPFLRGGYWKALLAFGVTSGAWPIFWSIHTWLMTGYPFYGLTDNRASIPAQLAVNPHGPFYELALSPGVIVLTLTPVAIAGTLYGLWLSLQKRKNLDFAFVVAFFALFQFATIATHGILALARYTLMLGTLCAAIAGYGLAELSAKVFGTRRDRTLAVLTAVLVANLALIVGLSQYRNPFEDKFRSVSPLMQFPVHVEEVGKILHPRMKLTDHVIVDNYNDEPNILGIAIGLPLLAGDRAFFVSDLNGTDPFPYLNSRHPRFAILSPRGMLGSSLDMPKDCSKYLVIRGIEFQCIFRNNIYWVYEIHYRSTTS